ncbi:MAG: hydrolase TatD [Crenarchaeota archaeon]|nr:hydrolase TatD [Thermoproteota archaeon]
MVPVADAHTHSNPVKGLGMEKIAPKFKEAGGWFLAVVGLSPWHYGMEGTLENYERALKVVLAEAERAREAGLKASALFGFHPADVDKLLGSMSPEEVLSRGLEVLKIVEKYLAKGDLDGVGEVGRQHYKTTPVAVVISEMIMNRALEVARDYGAVVHLHLEQGGRITALDIKDRINRTNANKEKVVVHHARGKSLEAAVEEGLVATVPGVKGSLERAVKLEPLYMIESDHIDDPKRPGVVVYPWEMARVQRELLEEGLVDEDYLWKINVENIKRTYGVEGP